MKIAFLNLFILLVGLVYVSFGSGALHAQDSVSTKSKEQIALEILESFGGAKLSIDAKKVNSSQEYADKVQEFINIDRVQSRAVEAILSNHNREELELWLSLSKDPVGRSFLAKFSSTTRSLIFQVMNQEIAHAIRCTSLELRPDAHMNIGAYTAEQMLQNCRK